MPAGINLSFKIILKKKEVNPLAQSGGKMLYQNRIEELAKKILAEEAVVYMHIIDGFFETVERLSQLPPTEVGGM